MNTKPHWNQTLSDAQIREIRQLASTGMERTKILERFKAVGRVHISAIIRGTTRLQAGGPILQDDGTFKVLEPGLSGKVAHLQDMATNSTDLKRIRRLEKKLSPACGEALVAEKIGLSTAYELTRLPKDQQDAFLERAQTMTRDEFRELVSQFRNGGVQAVALAPEMAELQYRTRVTSNPDRFIPKEVVTPESRRDIAYYLRLAMETTGIYADLRGKSLDEVLALLNVLREKELLSLAGTSYYRVVKEVKPYPKRYQALLGKVIGKAYGLVLTGPVRAQVFKTQAEIQELEEARTRATVVPQKNPVLEASLQELGVPVNELQTQIRALLQAVDMGDPTRKLEEIMKLISGLDGSIDGQMGSLAAKLQQIELQFKTGLGTLNTEVMHLARAVAAIQVETNGMTKEMKASSDFIQATRNRILEEKRQGLQTIVTPGTIP